MLPKWAILVYDSLINSSAVATDYIDTSLYEIVLFYDMLLVTNSMHRYTFENMTAESFIKFIQPF